MTTTAPGANGAPHPAQADITPQDVDVLRRERETCEAKILQLLRDLCARTGLDLEGVTVRTLVQGATDDARGPQAVPFAVKIVLAV